LPAPPRAEQRAPPAIVPPLALAPVVPPVFEPPVWLELDVPPLDGLPPVVPERAPPVSLGTPPADTPPDVTMSEEPPVATLAMPPPVAGTCEAPPAPATRGVADVELLPAVSPPAPAAVELELPPQALESARTEIRADEPRGEVLIILYKYSRG